MFDVETEETREIDLKKTSVKLSFYTAEGEYAAMINIFENRGYITMTYFSKRTDVVEWERGRNVPQHEATEISDKTGKHGQAGKELFSLF